MKRFGITCTMIYNGYTEVDAGSEEEAMEKVRDMLDANKRCDFEDGGYFGDVYFGFGEATADYADEL